MCPGTETVTPSDPPCCRYINERLSFGLAPETVDAAFGQRLRWSMGALQIVARQNPLQQVGCAPQCACRSAVLQMLSASHTAPPPPLYFWTV